MEKFGLRPGEKLLVNDPHAAWIKTEMSAIAGQLKLTDQRLVFVKNANEFAGPLKWFIRSLRAHVLLEFQLKEIKNVSRADFGKTPRLIVDNGFERPKSFTTSKIEVLEAELKRMTRNFTE